MNDHWRELPQVPFLLRQTFVATKLRLSRQKYACRDKKLLFVATNTCLSRQAYFCRDKHVLSRQK